MARATTHQNSSDFEEYIRDLLECPVCMETIKSVPVYQCTNGHVICRDCIKKLNNCPICRNNSTPARSLKLEKIVQFCLKRKDQSLQNLTFKNGVRDLLEATEQSTDPTKLPLLKSILGMPQPGRDPSQPGRS